MPQQCEVKFSIDTINDLKALPKNVRQECFKKLDELENNINLGKPLKNLDGINLQGYYAIYVFNAKYRIVYTKKNTTYDVINIQSMDKPIADLIAIGKRNNKEVYKEAFAKI